MNRNGFKSALIMAFISLCSCSSYAAIDHEAQQTSIEGAISRYDESLEGQFRIEKDSPPPAVNGKGWSVSVDLLYWKASVGGTDYACVDREFVDLVLNQRQRKSVDLGWNWGLRAGLGYHIPHDNWDLGVRYSWWKGVEDSSASSDQSHFITPLKGNETLTTQAHEGAGYFVFCKKAKSDLNVNYQTFDVELSRNYYITSDFSLRPLWGLETAYMRFNQTTEYTGGAPIADKMGREILGLMGNTVHIHDTNHCIGTGLRTGLESCWHLGEGFSLFGNFSFNLLWGRFKVNHEEVYSLDQNRAQICTDIQHAFAPNTQLSLGLRYDMYMQNNHQHLGFGVGFEGQYWWDQNRSLSQENSRSRAARRLSHDVAFYGITADVRWDF